MTLSTPALLDELDLLTAEALGLTKNTFLTLPESLLNARPAPEKWSAAECLEHLNRYAEFYHPAFRVALAKSASLGRQHQPNFTPGWLGNYSAQSMKPKNGAISLKMKTFSSKDPSKSHVDPQVIQKFGRYQEELADLLRQARQADLRMRVPITLPLLTFQLGDALRFVIYHNERHLLQAVNALKAARS